MKNTINFPIKFKKIPKSVKKYLYIHDDLYRWKPISSRMNQEKLVEIFDDEIKLEPFWLDEMILTGDKELDELLFLESAEMAKYIEKNGGKFGIFVRESVKKKLLKIEKKLNKKWYYLALKIGYRPKEVQKNLFKKIHAYYQKKYSHLSAEEIYDMTTEMISNPDKDVSPHLTGGAVDVVLYTKKGEEVDMGCSVNYIGEKANLTTIDITPEQQKNRDILTNAFLKAWFATLASEWWHFSYGDPYWAEFYGEKKALYDAI